MDEQVIKYTKAELVAGCPSGADTYRSMRGYYQVSELSNANSYQPYDELYMIN